MPRVELVGRIGDELRRRADTQHLYRAYHPAQRGSVRDRDGNDLVMTHYCAAQNQPRLRAKTVTGNVVAMDFDGGTNVDPAKDVHIHAVKIEILGPDEIREEWIGWKDGKLETPSLVLHLKRK